MHAVIFDIDGTLLQSASADDEIYKESVEAVLGPVSFRSSLSDYDDVTDSGILHQVIEDNSRMWEARVVQAIKHDFLKRTELHISHNGPFAEIPGARRLLAYLSGSPSHKVAIATGGWRLTAKLKLDSAGFNITGIPLATSDDAMVRAEIMKIALAGLDRHFDKITYFGDGEWDQAACSTLGWSFVAVGSALGGIESFHEAIVA